MERDLQLQPLGIAKLFDKAFSLYRSHFSLFLGLTAMLIFPTTVLRMASVMLFENPVLGDLVRSLFVAVIANLALTVSVATLYHRRSISIRQALRISSRRYLSALGAIILIGIGAAVPIFALAALLVFSGFSDGGSALGLLGLILFIPVFLYFALRIGFVHQAIVIENQGASNAIRRSWDLTAGQFWHVFGTLILAGILTYILAGIPEALITFAFQYIEAPIFLSMLMTILVQDLSLVLTMPYSLAITTLLYYNLRVRKEGYDLMVRANPGLSPA